MAHVLTPEEKTALSKSIKSLSNDGPIIATRMYDIFFKQHPELIQYFSVCFLGKEGPDDGSAPKITLMAKVMAHILYQFIINIENAGAMFGDLDRVAAKHFTRSIRPEYFTYLGDALITSLKETMGPKADDLVVVAWRKAYDKISQVLINKQVEITEEAMTVPNAFEGFIPAIVVKTSTATETSSSESDDENQRTPHTSTRLHFKRKDGKPFPEYAPLNYICLRIKLDSGVTMRNYHLIGPGGNAEEWVIDLKHEGSGSIVSSFVRHKLENNLPVEFDFSMPCGTFLLLESLSN